MSTIIIIEIEPQSINTKLSCSKHIIYWMISNVKCIFKINFRNLTGPTKMTLIRLITFYID